MPKKENEEEPEAPKEEQESEKGIVIVNQPTEFQQLFRTPEGDFDLIQYLAWLGNQVLQLRKGITG